MIYRLRSLLIDRSRHRAGRKYAILLAVALLFAQYVLIAHQIDHQSDASEAPCDLCLTAQYQGSTPISKDIPPAIVYGQDSIAFSAIVGLLSSRIITGFSARAPPFFLHA